MIKRLFDKSKGHVAKTECVNRHEDLSDKPQHQHGPPDMTSLIVDRTNQFRYGVYRQKYTTDISNEFHITLLDCVWLDDLVHLHTQIPFHQYRQ